VTRPRLLDLFCGAGGAAVGYHRAGFDVVGVDIEPQPHYPFEFFQVDALEVLRWWHLRRYEALMDHGFAAIHASPPCQAFTQMSAKHRGKGGLADQRVDLLTPTLEFLRPMDIPWVVENVQGSVPPLRPILKLHGGMFGLGVHRPRLFESNVMLLAPRMPECKEPVGVYGNAPDSRALWVRKNPRYRNNGNWRTAANPKKSVLRAPSNLAHAQEAMGMDWADWHGTKEAIPPAYTEFIGTQLLAALRGEGEG
jgi:DNA (cytosine-5)-methyltransferase 1